MSTISDTRFYPFGLVAEQLGGSEIRLQFTGQERDDSLALDYMIGRFSQPATGRFLSVDPTLAGNTELKDPSTWHRYAYVGNSPLRYVDPLGLVKFESDEAEKAYNEAREYLMQSQVGTELIEQLESLTGAQEPTVALTDGNSQFLPNTTDEGDANTILFNPAEGLEVANSGGSPDGDGGTIQSPALGFGHEAAHAIRFNTDRKGMLKDGCAPPPS